jgi:hypothetical protein
MAYTEKDLTDGVTPLNEELLGHFQKGIINAHEQLSTALFAVLTPEKMDEILSNATKENVGGYYMYLGKTTIYNGRSYKKGAVYTIEEV